MHGEEIARALHELVTVKEELQLRVARSERQTAECERDHIQSQVERERAVTQLAHVREDLSLVINRLTVRG